MAVTRLTGLTSGMDTDQMVKDLMKAESARLNKVKKEQTYVSWQQEAYRDIITKVKALQSKYFDSLNPKKNISSSSAFGMFSYKISSNGVASTAVDVTANADITSKNYTIDSITQLATKDTMSGVASGMRGVTTSGFDMATFESDMNMEDFSMSLSIAGKTKVISIAQSEYTGLTTDQFKDLLNTKITSEFGSDYTNIVSNVNGELKFDLAGSNVKVFNYTGTTSLTALGFTSGQSNYDFSTKSIGEIFGLTDTDLTNLKVNGKTFSLSASDNYSTMMSKLNKAGLGATLSYDSMKDKFSLTSNTEGNLNNIEIESGSSTEAFFSKIFGVADFSSTDYERTEGKNALLSINGVSVVQSSNTFTIDGLTYNLKETSTNPVDIAISVDKTSIIDNIKEFVTEFNKLIDDVSTKYGEKRYYDYEPLTDDERDALSDDEVTKWEEKAKSGVIRGSSELDTFITRLRNALVEPVDGVGISLSSIGITSNSYLDKGKLSIDETKLSEKLETNYDDIVNLFSQQSDQPYLTGNSSERYKESGIGSRLNDIMNDYARTTRDDKGNKGILVNKAGVLNDSSVLTNELTKKMLDYDTRISTLEDYLSDKETYYYNMFSAMETAMSKLQSQADSLVNMLGSN